MNIPCYKAYDSSVSGVLANKEFFRLRYFLTSTDPCHLNENGHQYFSPIIAQWLVNVYEQINCIIRFQDVHMNDWYAEAVQFVVDHGLFNGVSEREFSPTTPMNRAMLVTVLYRASGSPNVADKTCPFNDVPLGEYFYDAVVWAYSTGVVNGTSPTTFSPESNLTREQLATMLYRFDGQTNDIFDTSVIARFDDADEILPYASAAMVWAVGNRIVNGISDTELDPSASATRAQTAKMLQNYFENMEKEET